jgi:hypothetical protein
LPLLSIPDCYSKAAKKLFCFPQTNPFANQNGPAGLLWRLNHEEEFYAAFYGIGCGCLRKRQFVWRVAREGNLADRDTHWLPYSPWL